MAEGKKSYSEKLRDPRWQKKRLEILNRDNFKCQQCFDNEKTLHVHHRLYNNIEPWEYENHLLVTLCEDCHKWQSEQKPINNLLNTLYKIGVNERDFNVELEHSISLDIEKVEISLRDFFINKLKDKDHG